MEISSKRQARLKKRPHNLHRCTNAESLIDELRSQEIDLVSLIYEFVKPSSSVGILATGSIAWGVATALSDLDVLVLLSGNDALKTNRKRDVSGNIIKYLPTDQPNTAEVSLFLSGIEIDVLFISNSGIDGFEPAESRNVLTLTEAVRAFENSFLNRLATGWIVHGEDVVRHWRKHYETDKLRIKWMAAEFTTAAKNLEDIEAGIGLAKGHVATIGMYSVTHLLRALLAYNRCYCTSNKWMLKIHQLIHTVDSPMREALVTGRELAFPSLLAGVEEEKAYFDRVYGYCGTVRSLLSREEDMADILTSIIHDLDIIL